MAQPPDPTVILPPLIIISPPVDVFASLLLPAFKVTALVDALVVAIVCEMVRLPVSVATFTVPVVLIPSIPPAEPIVKASLLM